MLSKIITMASTCLRPYASTYDYDENLKIDLTSQNSGCVKIANSALDDGCTVITKNGFTGSEKKRIPSQSYTPDIGRAMMLFKSPMNEMIALYNMNGVPVIKASFSGSSVHMRGITKLIKNCFFPTYEYKGKDPNEIKTLPVNKMRNSAAKRQKKKGADRGITN
jgi:hypothetical protein